MATGQCIFTDDGSFFNISRAEVVDTAIGSFGRRTDIVITCITTTCKTHRDSKAYDKLNWHCWKKYLDMLKPSSTNLQ